MCIKAIQAAKIIILVSLKFNREFGKICFLYIILSIKLKLLCIFCIKIKKLLDNMKLGLPVLYFSDIISVCNDL